MNMCDKNLASFLRSQTRVCISRPFSYTSLTTKTRVKKFKKKGQTNGENITKVQNRQKAKGKIKKTVQHQKVKIFLP